MKVVWLMVVVVVLGGIGWGTGSLPPPPKPYKILMVLPFSAYSHMSMLKPFAKALADRGHEVVMLTNMAPSLKHQNIREVFHGLTNMFQNNTDPFSLSKKFPLKLIVDMAVFMTRNIYNVPEVMELYRRRKDFDLMVVDVFYNEMMYPFVHEVPFITFCPTTLHVIQSAVLGNPLNPALYTNFNDNYPRPMSLRDRVDNLLSQATFYSGMRLNLFAAVQEEITARFPHLPPLEEIERNQSLSLINYHFSQNEVVPLLPSQLDVAGLHCHPAEPLSQKLEAWVEGAGEAGVVYFSLGSFTKGVFMPVHYRDMFLAAFGQLKQRVIWKFEEELQGIPDNVLFDTWIPQQDVLGDPRVKVFITQGGRLSTLEAVYHSTPMVALPIVFDQFNNVARLTDAGLAIVLYWKELSPQLIVDTVREVINNPKYTERMKEASFSFRDRPLTPLDKAVFWSEYVIRHQGAPQLRSPAIHLSWVEFLMLDVLVVILVTVFIIIVSIWCLLKKVWRRLFGGGKEKEE